METPQQHNCSFTFEYVNSTSRLWCRVEKNEINNHMEPKLGKKKYNSGKLCHVPIITLFINSVPKSASIAIWIVKISHQLTQIIGVAAVKISHTVVKILSDTCTHSQTEPCVMCIYAVFQSMFCFTLTNPNSLNDVQNIQFQAVCQLSKFTLCDIRRYKLHYVTFHAIRISFFLFSVFFSLGGVCCHTFIHPFSPNKCTIWFVFVVTISVDIVLFYFIFFSEIYYSMRTCMCENECDCKFVSVSVKWMYWKYISFLLKFCSFNSSQLNTNKMMLLAHLNYFINDHIKTEHL